MSAWVPETHLEKALCPTSLEEVEEHKQWPLSGVRASHKSEYGPSPSSSPHQICMLLEVSGAELFTLVHIRAERQRSY